MLLIWVGCANGVMAKFYYPINDLASWNAAMEKLKTVDDNYFIFRINADLTFTENITFDRDLISEKLHLIDLELNGHKINVNKIVVNNGNNLGNPLSFRLIDPNYTAVSFNSSDMTVSNTNSGCLNLTESIDVMGKGAYFFLDGAVINAENSKYSAVRVLGDQTPGSTERFGNFAYIVNGYILGREGCVSAFGRTAKVYVKALQLSIPDVSNVSVGSDNALPVLCCLDNAPVAGNGTNNATNYCGGTVMNIGKSIIVGNIETPGYVACGIYHPQYGKLNIEEGAKIYANGGVGVLMRGGTLSMTGGEIVATGDKDLTGKVGDSRVVVPTSGIVFDDYAGYYDHSNVNVAVSGGTVTGSHSAVEVVKGADSTTPENQIQLSGGTYSSDIALFAAEGNGMQKSNGTYTLGDEVAKVEYADGTVGRYAKLQDALDAATDGSTVKLMKDVEGVSLHAGNSTATDNSKSIVLDLNGNKISLRQAVGGRFYVYCSLTVTDSKGNGCIESYGNQTGIYTELFYIDTKSANAHLTLDGGKYTASYLVYYDDYYTGNPLIELKNGYFDCGGLLRGNTPDTPNCKIYKGYFKVDDNNLFSISTYLVDGYEKLTYTTGDYSVRTRMKPIILTYGETPQELEVDDKSVVIDLKDDAATAAERLSKIQIQVEKANADVTLKKNFAKANTWNAFYVPFDITATAELLEKFDIAKIWDTELYWSNGTPETTIELIKLNEGDQIAAFTPCLIRAKEAGLQDVTFRDVTLYNTNATNSVDCSTVEQKFTFTGVLANTLLNGNYAFNANGQLVHSTNSAAQVTPLKFYMTIENKDGSTVQKAQAYRVHVIGEETTGISDVNVAENHQQNGVVYNLQGVAVGNTMVGLPAGVYVQNGRKVIVK